MNSRPPAIVVRHLTIAFGALRALDAVSFEVPVGSITGLIGRNGAGKTTCIRCLAGLLTPSDDGSAISVHGASPRRERRRVVSSVGFLLSEPALFPYLTPTETLVYLGRAFGIDPAAAQSRASELLEFFDLAGAADRLADDFSTGMSKRLALAAAMVHSPRTLILDEPFESLDPLMVRSLKKLLRAYRSGGGTVLLSSHLLNAVEEVCDRVVILEGGRLVASGPTDEVRASISARLPSATLEDLYASLVPETAQPTLGWLTGDGGSRRVTGESRSKSPSDEDDPPAGALDG